MSTIERWVVIGILFFLAVLWNSYAGAKPVAYAEKDGVRVTLYDEPCKLTAHVDLPYRATWDKGKDHFEGCYSTHGAGLVVAYFEDKTIALIPLQVFRPARET